MLSNIDILRICTQFYTSRGDNGRTLSEFFKEDKRNIYALWPEGKVPVEHVIVDHKLAETHLCPLDLDNYSQFMEERRMVGDQIDTEEQETEDECDNETDTRGISQSVSNDDDV